MPQRTDSLFQPQQGTVVGTTSIVTPDANPSLWAGASERAAESAGAIVAGSGLTIAWELYRATIDNALVEEISDHLVGGSIDLNVDRTVKLAAQFTLRDPDVVTPYTDYLAPFIRIEYDDGSPALSQQVGLFRVSVPPGTYSPNDANATFDGADLTAVMASSYYTDTRNIAAGANYVSGTNGIIGGISGAGINRYNIPATTATLPTAQSFPIGMSRLEKDNILLDQLGWYHLGMDLDGRISTPGAVRELRYVEPFRTLTDTGLLAPIEIQAPGQPPFNVIIVINDDATAAPLHSVARNDDASSPTSTVNIGEQMREPIKVQGSTTQAALDAQAARFLAESRTYYRTAQLKILPDPNAFIAHQTVDLALSGRWASLSGRWRVSTARMGFTPDTAAVDLEVNQITDDVNGVTV